jgi:hypothetical protein
VDAIPVTVVSFQRMHFRGGIDVGQYSIVKERGCARCDISHSSVEHARARVLRAKNRKLLMARQIEFSLSCHWILISLLWLSFALRSPSKQNGVETAPHASVAGIATAPTTAWGDSRALKP